ncbi:MAG: YdcH family protein [Alphaproteobacteria bacterium]|nr:YdcH family protein [Alphaproteobacteria bacterium]
MSGPMEADVKAERLAALRSEHADLDYAIAALTEQVPFDQLQVQRLKKRKLWLRDMIAKLEAQDHPDLIA